MARSASGQGEPNRAMWLATRASHLARSGLPALSSMKNFPESHIINTLLTKFVGSRWLDIGLVLFFASLQKHAKKGLGQYPAILTSHLVNNPYILFWFTNFIEPPHFTSVSCHVAKDLQWVSSLFRIDPVLAVSSGVSWVPDVLTRVAWLIGIQAFDSCKRKCNIINDRWT